MPGVIARVRRRRVREVVRQAPAVHEAVPAVQVRNRREAAAGQVRRPCCHRVAVVQARLCHRARRPHHQGRAVAVRPVFRAAYRAVQAKRPAFRPVNRVLANLRSRHHRRDRRRLQAVPWHPAAFRLRRADRVAPAVCHLDQVPAYRRRADLREAFRRVNQADRAVHRASSHPANRQRSRLVILKDRQGHHLIRPLEPHRQHHPAVRAERLPGLERHQVRQGLAHPAGQALVRLRHLVVSKS